MTLISDVPPSCALDQPFLPVSYQFKHNKAEGTKVNPTQKSNQMDHPVFKMFPRSSNFCFEHVIQSLECLPLRNSNARRAGHSRGRVLAHLLEPTVGLQLVDYVAIRRWRGAICKHKVSTTFKQSGASHGNALFYIAIMRILDKNRE